MMRLNFMLAALFVASAVAAPVHSAVPSLPPPSPQVPTAVPTTVTLPARGSQAVPTSVWQHDRRVQLVDSDSVRPLSHPVDAGALPLLPSHPSHNHGDKSVNVHLRALTNTLGSVTTVAVPFPSATTPTVHAHAHAHVHREPSGCDDEDADEDEDEKRELHARMLALPIKGLAPPHAAHTTTLNSIRVRQLFLPTALFNVAAAAKVTAV
ncbi:hypothetical protein GSI_11416 [Ganoderma sinense ZZ0214-1]|uniref:Secreted protein n=1 Tax=Ganoderma sinense ZZ0214-1 TaxID=1077348 RepID=A0A2G8RVW6_9APHY|nr:hypothetical protein GSI_11416 [Ganoderma sinense ZZ0214-1]